MKKNKLYTCMRLFGAFSMIGAFTFGGGYAMIPLIRHEVCDKRKWISEDEIPDIIAIAESTPGPLAINAATFIGSRMAGISGAFFATLGVVLPSFLIMSVISVVLNAFAENRYVVYAFKGIRAGVMALLIKALWSMYKKCPKKLFSYIIMAAAFVITAFTKISVVCVILVSGAAGLIKALLAERRNKAC